MQLKKKVLSVLAIVILAILGTTFGLSVALADTSERAIPAIGAASPSAGTIHVTWETPGDVDTLNSYRVSWSQDDSGMTSYREANSSTGGNAYPDAPATSYTITGLDAGAYYVLVRSRYDDGDNGAFKKAGPVEVTDTTQTDQQEEDSTPTATPEPTATPAPTATPQQQAEPDRNIPTIGASSPSAGAIDIIWGAPSETGDLNSYRVSWSQDASGMTSYREANSSTGGNAYPDAPAASYTITGLDAGAYYVLVRARYDDGDNGAWKKAGPVQVAATPEPTPEATPEPGAITGLEMTSSGAGRLWIEWDEPDPEPSGYRLNWARVGRSFPAAGSGYGGNISYPYNEINFSNLVDRGVTYKFRVRALYNADPDNSWSGPWSEVATRRVRDNPPGAPTDLSVDSATHDGVALTWSAPSHTGLTGYRILRGPDAGALETIVDDTGDLSLSYTDTTAADDATHHYAVMALSLDGDGRQSATVSATTPPRTPEAPLIEGAPAAPAGLTARLDGTGGVTLGWTDPDDDAITGYRILRGDDALSMRVIVEDTGSAAVSYTDTGLAANLTRVYAVQARNATGLSQLSNTVSITTLAAPTALDASASSAHVSLSWTAPGSAGITGYQVLRGATAQNLQPLGKSTGSAKTFHTDFDVSPLRTYHYAVRALSAHGAGPLSETHSVTTQPRISVLRFVSPDSDEPLVARQQQAVTSRTLISNMDRPNVTLAPDNPLPDDVFQVINSDSGLLSADYEPGTRFTTGSHPGGYNVTAIKTALHSVDNHISNETVTEFKAFIRSDSGGSPGSVLYTFNAISDPSGSDVTLEFTAPGGGFALEPDTTYWATFRVTGGEGTVNLRVTRETHFEDECLELGWSTSGNNLYIRHRLGNRDSYEHAVKFAVVGAPAGPNVPENRCMDLPAGTGTTGRLAVGGYAMTSEYPAKTSDSTPGDRDWFAIDLKANVLYQFGTVHAKGSLDYHSGMPHLTGGNRATLGSALVHRVLDSTGAEVTSGRTNHTAQSHGFSKELVFFTPTADGTYYLETGVGPRRTRVNTVDLFVSWGACGTLPDATRQVKSEPYDEWRHPDYNGFWGQANHGKVLSCYRRWMHRWVGNDNVRYGGTYTVYAVAADDYSADTNTTGVIAPGGKEEGYLYQSNGANNDEDWFKVSMTRGTTYNFEFDALRPGVCSQITGIYDSDGTMVHGPAEGNPSWTGESGKAMLEYTAPSTATYYVGVDECGTVGDYFFYGSQYRLTLN